MSERLKIDGQKTGQKTVLDKVAYRIKTGSKLGQREDPWDIALTVESAGLGGVVSGAELLVLVALTNADAKNPDDVKMPFDKVFAASSASCNVACWLSGKGRVGLKTYFEELAGGSNGLGIRFINRHRRFSNFFGWDRYNPTIDIDFLMKTLKAKKALDFQRVEHFQKQGLELHIYSTDYLTGQPIDWYPIKSDSEFQIALKSSCAVTHFSGPLPRFGDAVLTDGGVSVANLPLEEAIRFGSSDILSLMINPAEAGIKSETSLKVRVFNRMLAATFPPDLGRSFLQGRKKQINALSRLQEAEASAKVGLILTPNIQRIEISNPRLAPSLMDDDPTKLYLGAQAGQAAGLGAMILYNLPLAEGVLLV